MIIKNYLKKLILILSLIPSVVLAEVSDKVPSVSNILFLGLLIGTALFLLSRLCWWLGTMLLVVPFFFITESVALWNEVSIREALLQEQGWIYFCVLGLQDVLILVAIVAGIIVGYKRYNLLKGRDIFKSR